MSHLPAWKCANRLGGGSLSRSSRRLRIPMTAVSPCRWEVVDATRRYCCSPDVGHPGSQRDAPERGERRRVADAPSALVMSDSTLWYRCPDVSGDRLDDLKRGRLAAPARAARPGRSGPATAAGPGRPTRWAAALARTLDAAGGVPGTAATTSPISLAESRTTERRDDVATVDLDASPSSCRGVSVATERPPHAAPRRPTPGSSPELP